MSKDRNVLIKLLNPGNDPVGIPKGNIISKFNQLPPEMHVKKVDENIVQNINLLKSDLNFLNL